MRAGLLSVVLASAASAAETDCNLAGDGNLEHCQGVYWRTRIAAAFVPAYIFQSDGRALHPGLSWTLAVDVPKDGWEDYFSLGAVERPSGGFPFQLGVAASFVWLPGHLYEGRLVLRARVISLFSPNQPGRSYLHLTAAGGAAYGTDGAAPRIELRLRIGDLAWGGVVVAAGFQPFISSNHYVGDVSFGIEAPWVWWW